MRLSFLSEVKSYSRGKVKLFTNNETLLSYKRLLFQKIRSYLFDFFFFFFITYTKVFFTYYVYFEDRRKEKDIV